MLLNPMRQFPLMGFFNINLHYTTSRILRLREGGGTFDLPIEQNHRGVHVSRVDLRLENELFSP